MAGLAGQFWRRFLAQRGLVPCAWRPGSWSPPGPLRPFCFRAQSWFLHRIRQPLQLLRPCLTREVAHLSFVADGQSAYFPSLTCPVISPDAHTDTRTNRHTHTHTPSLSHTRPLAAACSAIAAAVRPSLPVSLLVVGWCGQRQSAARQPAARIAHPRRLLLVCPLSGLRSPGCPALPCLALLCLACGAARPRPLPNPPTLT